MRSPAALALLEPLAKLAAIGGFVEQLISLLT